MTLPNFIVAGAKKCGTTSIYEYLKQHPQVYMSPLKEPRFFAYDPTDPEHTKLNFSHFPVRTFDEYVHLFDGANDAVAIGEASPMYISSLFALKQVKKTIPTVKLIFCLRHPVDRAYSLYLMRVRHGFESRPAYQAFAEDGKRWTRFKYYQMLKPWFDEFDRSQIKVLIYEDFRANPLATMQQVFQFLEVDSDFVPDVSRKYGAGGVPKNKALHQVFTSIRKNRIKKLFAHYLPPQLRAIFNRYARKNLKDAPAISNDVRQLLTDLYRADTTQLEGLLQRDLSIWKFEEKAYR